VTDIDEAELAKRMEQYERENEEVAGDDDNSDEGEEDDENDGAEDGVVADNGKVEVTVSAKTVEAKTE
jgi:hypothetical protein